MDPLIVKMLADIRTKYPDAESIEQVSDWEKSLKKSSLFINLQEHAAFKIIVDGYKKELGEINKALSTKRELFEDEKGRLAGFALHERKRFILDFLRPFSQAQVNIGYVTNELKKALTDDK